MPNSFLKGTPLAHVLNFQFKIGTYSPGDKFEVYLNGLYQGDLINFNQTTWNPITLDVPIYSGNGNTIIDWKITRGQAGSLPSPVMYLDAVQYFVTFPIQGTNDLKIPK
ncbi:MAG: hypothetical protein EB060_12350 [Proteobacteria bacterium]|nr:hypothetical protein [Pseudomonadota bacterium]